MFLHDYLYLGSPIAYSATPAFFCQEGGCSLLLGKTNSSQRWICFKAFESRILGYILFIDVEFTNSQFHQTSTLLLGLWYWELLFCHIPSLMGILPSAPHSPTTSFSQEDIPSHFSLLYDSFSPSPWLLYCPSLYSFQLYSLLPRRSWTRPTDRWSLLWVTYIYNSNWLFTMVILMHPDIF